MRANGSTLLNQHGDLFGVLAFIAGAIAALGVTMIGFTSFTAFNPPGWLRIATMAPLPLAILLSLAFGLVAIKRGSGRSWAIAGWALAGLSVIAFIVMIAVGG